MLAFSHLGEIFLGFVCLFVSVANNFPFKPGHFCITLLFKLLFNLAFSHIALIGKGQGLSHYCLGIVEV